MTGLPGFTPVVGAEAIADLRNRLERARLPEAETGPGQGIARRDLVRLLETWRSTYDWQRLRRRLTSVPQVRAEIDGLRHHALHAQPAGDIAGAVLLGHGWPSTCFEFLDLLPLLTDPVDGPAFAVVCPSLPGYGFSDRPAEPGWNADRIADAWAELMERLGYDRFVVHGGDWGAIVGTALAIRHPDRVRGLHLTMPSAEIRREDEPRAGDHPGAVAFRSTGYDYARIQHSRPQTIGYGLVDSPVALLAWLGEKLLTWSGRDASGDPLLTDDQVLDMVSVYWLTATGASAARMYAESLRQDRSTRVRVPTWCTIFADEVVRTPRSAVERRFSDLRSWREQPLGGHFPAAEVPQVLAAELREFIAQL